MKEHIGPKTGRHDLRQTVPILHQEREEVLYLRLDGSGKRDVYKAMGEGKQGGGEAHTEGKGSAVDRYRIHRLGRSQS